MRSAQTGTTPSDPELRFQCQPNSGKLLFDGGLGAFPADAWGIRYALNLLADGGVVALFPQGMISKNLATTCGAAGLLALYSGAPVVPVAIRGTEDIHLSSMFTGRVNVCVRFGTPLTYSRLGARTPRSRVVSDVILCQIRGLLAD